MSQAIASADVYFRGRDLLTRLLTSYLGMAEKRYADRQEELFLKNGGGLRDAIEYVSHLEPDDPMIVRLDRWMDEAGIDEWHWRLLDGGWWSDLYYNCTRFRAFGNDEVEPFVAWIVDFYVGLPHTLLDDPSASRPMDSSTAHEALYIDFEGRQQGPPLMLGVLFPGAPGADGRFQQWVFDPLFAEAAEARGAHLMTLEHAVALLSRFARKGLAIVAWSSHEREQIAALGSTEAEVVVRRYKDGKELAKHWRKKVRPDLQPERDRRRGRHRLDFYLDAIGYDVPSIHGPGLTGSRIKDVRAALERHEGHFDRLTSTQKGKWTNLLEHNRHDCVGMKAFCLRATEEIEQSAQDS